MDYQIVRFLPEDQWRSFVENHPKGNIFHTPEMFEIYRKAKGHTPELWSAVDEGRILALFIPVRITLKERLPKRLTTRAVSFGGPLVEDSPEGQFALVKLLETYKRQADASLFTELRNISDINTIQPILCQAKFNYEDHLNYLIRLDRKPENVFGKIGTRTRKHIRHEMKRNIVHILEINDRTQIPVCYELLSHTYRNARVPLADLSLFYSAFDILVPRQMARFTLAFVGDEPSAVSIDLLYKDVMYGWYGGVDRRFISYAPNEVLMWNVLEWGCNNGYRMYDFGGAGKPNEKYGVRDFKAKFGGDLVCFGRNIWVTNPTLMALSKLAYSTLRRIIF